MATRIVEWKKPYTWWEAITVDENKVISLNLREENNLIIYDSWDDEIYVDLQLPDEITPTDAFPVWITTGRVIVDNWWDTTGTIICAKTTSGDNIKILYADDGKLYMDNGTWTFKQIYFKSDVDALLLALRNYIDWELAKKQDVINTITVTLASANRNNDEITVTATGVTATNSVIVSPVPSDISDYTSAGIYCSAQGTDSLTFSCSTTPSGDIDVNVMIIN